MLADQIAMDAFLKERQGTDMEIVATAPPTRPFGEGIGVGVRKDDTELLAKINAGIKALRESGEYDRIAKQYFDFDIYGPQG
jgi:polar amino acid transport system substrate-binding protein